MRARCAACNKLLRCDTRGLVTPHFAAGGELCAGSFRAPAVDVASKRKAKRIVHLDGDGE